MRSSRQETEPSPLPAPCRCPGSSQQTDRPRISTNLQFQSHLAKHKCHLSHRTLEPQPRHIHQETRPWLQWAEGARAGSTAEFRNSISHIGGLSLLPKTHEPKSFISCLFSNLMVLYASKPDPESQRKIQEA